MLHVILWKWQQRNFRETYTFQHVNLVSQMIRYNLPGIDVRVVCVTDEPYGIDKPTQTFPLWNDHDGVANVTGQHLPSCYRRLKLFDRSTQIALGIREGERIMSLDLDTIILRPFNDVLERIDECGAVYSGWVVRGTFHRRVFNGSFWTFSAGKHLQHMWSAFDPRHSPREALSKGFLGSDQGWLSMHFAKHDDALGIGFPEFASYPRDVRHQRRVDDRTKIVFFHGARKPWHVQERLDNPWINQVWRPQP